MRSTYAIYNEDIYQQYRSPHLTKYVNGQTKEVKTMSQKI